jgi:arginine decarboxylase
MIEVYRNLGHTNTLETYHTTDQILNDSYNAFKLGLLSIEEWSEIETLYNLILQTIYLYRPPELNDTDEFRKIKKLLASQYLCNFSVFQSTIDCWAIEQLLPIVPLQRLDEMPTIDTILVDITCDSDGKIKHYLNSEGGSSPMDTLKLHKLSPNEEYYIGIFLTGAYQDVMGDMHNLFGRSNEVHVYADEQEDDGFYIEEVIPGNRSSDVLKIMQYSPNTMARQVKKEFDQLIKEKKIMAKRGIELANFYENLLQEYTYLK